MKKYIYTMFNLFDSEDTIFFTENGIKKEICYQ